MNNHESSPLSRRQIFTNTWNKLTGKNREYPGEVENTVEIAAESGSLLSIALMAIEGSKDQLVYYDASSELTLANSGNIVGQYQEAQELADVFEPTNTTLHSLGDTWQDIYLVTKSRPKTTIQCRNNKCTPVTTTEFYTEWNEPNSITSRGLDHNVIDQWRSVGSVISAIQGISEEEAQGAFNISNEGRYVYLQERQIDQNQQNMIAGLMYGTEGTGFVFYEEAEEKIAEKTKHEPFFDNNAYIKRRSLLKLFGSMGLSYGIHKLQRATATNNETLGDTLESQVTDIVTHANTLTAEEQFNEFFGVSTLELRNRLLEIQDTVSTILAETNSNPEAFSDVGNHWGNVDTALRSVLESTGVSLSQFDEYFSYNAETGERTIPESLIEVIRAVNATRKITQATTNSRVDLEIRHVVNGAIMGGGMAATALIGEKAIFPAIDKLVKKIAD